MQIHSTTLADVCILEPKVFGDDRGFFLESFNAQTFAELTGLNVTFVQDNHSRSQAGVLRGLHYQIQQTQGKLVRCVVGEIFDVTVDLRQSSPQFGQWAGERLSAENYRQIWVPPGFAHGFLVLSEIAEVIYKTTDFYAPTHERSLRWDDPAIAINWPLAAGQKPQLSAKDAAAVTLADAEVFT